MIVACTIIAFALVVSAVVVAACIVAGRYDRGVRVYARQPSAEIISLSDRRMSLARGALPSNRYNSQ